MLRGKGKKTMHLTCMRLRKPLTIGVASMSLATLSAKWQIDRLEDEG